MVSNTKLKRVIYREAAADLGQLGDTSFMRSHAAERSARVECSIRGIHFGLPSAHARHFDADGNIVFRGNADKEKRKC